MSQTVNKIIISKQTQNCYSLSVVWPRDRIALNSSIFRLGVGNGDENLDMRYTAILDAAYIV
jgi:hypothetical protein